MRKKWWMHPCIIGSIIFVAVFAAAVLGKWLNPLVSG